MKFLLVFLLVFAACTKTDDSNTKVLRISTSGAALNLDPIQAASRYESLVMKNIYDTLYTYQYLKRPYEIKPLIADGMPKVSSDSLTFAIKIKKGVFYADDPCFKEGKGREVVAEDFVYSLKRHFDPKNRSRNTWIWRDRIVGLDEWKAQGADHKKEVEGFKAIDKYTVQIKLKKPFYQLINTLAMSASSLVPHEAVEKYGKEFSVKPVGSGPYTLKSFDTRRAVLVRNPKFRGEKLDLKAEGYEDSIHGYTGIKALDGKEVPISDRIEIYFMKEQDARWNSFTKGTEIQFATVPVKQLPNVVVTKTPVKLKPEYETKFNKKLYRKLEVVFALFNMDDKRVGYHPDPKQAKKNKALRCAIRKAFNWPQRIERFYHGFGEAFPGMIPPGMDGYDPKMSKESITQDVLGAKKLLSDSGWDIRSLPNVEYGGVSSVLAKQFFEQFRGWLREIGYPSSRVKYKPYATFGDFNKAMKERKVMYMMYAYSADYPDAENLLALFYGPNSSPGVNAANYNNPEYNKLYEKAALLSPSKERTKIYQKMNEILIGDCVAISGFSRTNIMLWYKNVLMYPDISDILGGQSLRYVGQVKW